MRNSYFCPIHDSFLYSSHSDALRCFFLKRIYIPFEESMQVRPCHYERIFGAMCPLEAISPLLFIFSELGNTTSGHRKSFHAFMKMIDVTANNADFAKWQNCSEYGKSACSVDECCFFEDNRRI